MDEQLITTDDVPFICEAISWTNGTGVDIIEYQIHSGTPPEGFARFRIGVTLNVDGKPAAHQTMAIPAETIEEAFAIAPQVIAGAEPEMVEKLKQHIQAQQPKPKIITAAQAREMGHNGNRQQRRVDAAQHNRMRGDF